MSASEAAAVANASHPENKVADLPKVEDGFRVYVGNLSYSTNEEQVRELVSKAGGEISSVTLPLRFGKRPAGYAFVSYKKEEDAKKVVEQLNGTELGDRKLRLEIAKPAEEVLANREAKDEKRKAAREAAKAAKAAKAQSAAPNGGEAGATTEGEAKDAADKPKKKKSSKARKPRRRLPEEGEEAEGAGEPSEPAVPKAAKPRKTAKEARIDVNGGEEEEKKERAPRPKKERKPRLQLTGEESKSTVFVANLPFNVDDDALAAIFTNLSIKVKSAKVVKGVRRARPGSRPFRASKGFGFVEIEDESQQAEAVSKVEGTLIGDRQITAKIAKEMKPIELEQAQQADDAAAEISA